MKKEDVREFLECIGVHSPVYRNNWFSGSCPLAPWTHESGRDSNPSFAINCIGDGRFNCFACHNGDLLYLVQLLKGYNADCDFKRAIDILSSYEEEELELEFPYKGSLEDVIWSDDYLDTFPKVKNVPKAAGYLEGRNVDDYLWEFFDLRFDTYREAVCFPVRNWANLLVGMRGRRLSGGYYMYGDDNGNKRNSLPWFGENLVDLNKPVLMVESVFDLMSVHPVYANVVAPLSVGMSKEKVLRMRNASMAVTLFDGDKGGDKGRQVISKYLDGVDIIHLSTGFYNDPNEMPRNEIIDMLTGVLV